MAEDRAGVVARLDALEAAHKAATGGGWANVEFTMQVVPTAFPALIAAVRGVLAEADRMDDQLAATGVRLDRCIRPGDRIRATVAAALGEA